MTPKERTLKGFVNVHKRVPSSGQVFLFLDLKFIKIIFKLNKLVYLIFGKIERWAPFEQRAAKI